jgi:hypothetical protein
MKVVGVSNFCDETISDILVCSEVNNYYGQRIVEMLNFEVNDYSRYYYKLKNDDYELYVWEP